MRKIALFIVFILIIIPFAIAEDVTNKTERVYYYSDNAAAWNINTVDLSKALYVPKYGTPYNKNNSNPDYGSREAGTYAKKTNVWGNVGCAYTDHEIEFTVYTDGRFVKQSDPSKYRNFYVALRPRIKYKNGNDDENFNYMRDLNSLYDDTLPVPNSKNGDIIVYSPAMIHNGNNNFSQITIGGQNKNVERFYYDICICMDELTTEDLTHLADGNDYIATIIIRWECTDPTCSRTDDNQFHAGSFVFVVNGFYNADASTSRVFVQLNPDPSSMNLDLVQIATQSHPISDIEVADLQIYTSPKDNNPWVNSLSVFVSASSNWNSSDQAGFRLKRNNNPNDYSIPYKVIIKDYNLVTNSISNTGNAEKEFDGTAAFSSLTDEEMISLDLAQQQMINKNGKSFYSIAYGGKVYISLDKNSDGDIVAIGPNGQPDYLVKDANSSDPILRETVSSALAGIYTSNIYYYIIYN